MPWKSLPDVQKCCGCVKDLKTAVAIIAVLGIVTSPSVAWVIVRHAYVVRVSCVITSNNTRPDVFDVNFNNVLSFGFAANAGLGPTCLSPQKSNTTSTLVTTVKYMGWVILISDLIFVGSSFFLLFHLFGEVYQKAVKYFMFAVAASVALSFIYAMLYVAACMAIGGSFPVFELIFGFVDMGLWVYFLIVVNSYRRKTTSTS